MSDLRLEASATERIARGTPVEFTFDGRDYRGLAGDSVGSALAASGVRVLSRSFKYHRPRGLLCCNGRCPNCMVNIDGEPNVRGCITPVREGMKVRSQNAWPSLAFDVLSISDRLERLLPIGFYYKVFYRPRVLWPYFEKVLRRIAGLGKVDVNAIPTSHAVTQHLHAEVAVVGGGPAGCLAALESAAAGASVILVDDQIELGGHWRLLTESVTGDARIDRRAGHEAAAKLRELIAAEPRIDVLTEATAFGIYEGGLVGVMRRDGLSRIRAQRVVVATGAQERPLLFINNDIPGVMLGTAALRLARLHGVRIGKRAVVLVDGEHGWRIARELRAAGIALGAVVDLRPASRAEAGFDGVEVIRGATVIAARGRSAVSALRIRTSAGDRVIACDLVAMSTRPEPVISLAAHEGIRRVYDERVGEFLSEGRSERVILAGENEGLTSAAGICSSGIRAGREAALEVGRGAEGDVATARAAHERSRGAEVAVARVTATDPHDVAGKRFVCFCEDVTTKELAQGIDEGFESLEVLKRYSTVTMGPCQGKMCHTTAARVRSSLAGETMDATGLTTARPPVQPVSLAILAGPHLDPVRRTAMHDRHEALGCRWMDMGEWKRPYVYTSVERECRAVRESVGMIDVSTLGKLDMRGADAAAFLDWLHPNRFSDLKVGRVRYRAMCDDAGIVLDDGTVARLEPERFFISTTTSVFEAVEQWMHWWLAASSRNARVTNVTSQYAAINLAGPRSRDVLARLTNLDVSREAMPYLAAVTGPVAGIDVVILRIGFVGELSYEIHVPADYGAHVWDALMEAGRDFGIEPFGVEAQRVLRLEKQHIIVGQDTDALSNPLESALGWLVKADKQDFVGKDAMAAVAARGARQALIGFEIPERTVPDEGAAILRGGTLVGRVTSAKWSETLGRTIGMAVVPSDMATDGVAVDIRRDGTTIRASVVLKPFYDPTGAKLRS